MSIAFVLLMRRYTNVCGLVACINFTIIFALCDAAMIAQVLT